MTQKEYDERLIEIAALPPSHRVRAMKELVAETGGAFGGLTDVREQVKQSLRDGRATLGDLAHRVAQAVLSEDYDNGDRLMLLKDARLWAYDGRVWARILIEQLGQVVVRRAEIMLEDGTLELDGISLSGLVQQTELLLKRMVAREDDPLCLMQPPPAILNCTNGELDLKTMKLGPHQPDSFLRIALDVEYDPTAKAPVFERVVREIMGGDLNMARHLTELMAYTLMPRKRFAGYILWIGDGANGKTELMKVLIHLLGPAVRTDRIQAIGHNNFAANALVGKTAFIDDDVGYNEGVLPIGNMKRVSEGKTIGGEVKHGGHFEFRCELTQLLGSNAYPVVRDTTHGFVRRAYVVKFREQWFLPNQIEIKARELGCDAADLKLADLNLEEKLRAEASGILNIMLDAMHALLKRGYFEEPPAAVAAREEWREASDTVLSYLRDAYEPAEGERVKLIDFRKGYSMWCEDGKMKPKGVRQITKALADGGCRIVTPSGVQYLDGYKPKVDAEAAAAGEALANTIKLVKSP